MKKLVLIALSLGLVGANSWAGCTFEKAEKALKAIDKNFKAGKVYNVMATSGDMEGQNIALPIENSGGSPTIGGAPACVSGGGGSALISFADVRVIVRGHKVSYVQGKSRGSGRIEY
jgi:hypothetical protein